MSPLWNDRMMDFFPRQILLWISFYILHLKAWSFLEAEETVVQLCKVFWKSVCWDTRKSSIRSLGVLVTLPDDSTDTFKIQAGNIWTFERNSLTSAAVHEQCNPRGLTMHNLRVSSMWPKENEWVFSCLLFHARRFCSPLKFATLLMSIFLYCQWFLKRICTNALYFCITCFLNS